MFVIGTAGHVDHGKTALIEALTGIDADRLPEEKKRGMTIDLGFAHFVGPDGEEIGVIDVPGHERFIRNMVAGAWSLDLGLLVIAVDDGWMEQTEDHARVLYGMGIHRIVLVLTKCDIADRDQIDLVREDAQENFFRLFETVPETVETSAFSGAGIDDLKATVIRLLADSRERDFGSFSTLYIDRVFSLPGTGTVITGSLTSGKIAAGTEVSLLPAGISARVRSMQSYYRNTDTARPVSRVAVNLQGVKRGEISRGMCMTDAPERFWSESEILILMREYPSVETSAVPKALRRQMEVEVSLGTFNTIARFYRLSNACGRLVLGEPAGFRWNQPLIVTGQGGSTPLAWGRVLWGGRAGAGLRSRIVESASSYDPLNLPDYTAFHLEIFGYARRRKPVESGGTAQSGYYYDAREIADWIVRDSLVRMIKDAAHTATAKPGGTTLPELSGGVPELKNLDAPLVEAIVSEMMSSGELVERRGVLFPPGKEGAETSKAGRKILETAAAKEPEAVTPKDLTIPGAQQEIRTLVREGLLIQLEGGLYYRPEAYTSLKEMIIEGLSPGSSFTIPEAKDRVGLSRKYIIPLLNRMEADKLVRRDGDQRVVL